MIIGVAAREASTMSGARGPTSTGTLDQTFQRALSFHQKGRLRTAEALYCAVLAADHRHFDALLYFGVLRLQQGEAEASATLIGKALAQNPCSAEAHVNIAYALQALERHDEAILCYERASALNPGYAEASHGLATLLQALGRYDEAIRHYKAALAIKPGFAEASYGLATAHHALLRYDQATKHYETALAISPGVAEASYGLATAHHALLRYDQA